MNSRVPPALPQSLKPTHEVVGEAVGDDEVQHRHQDEVKRPDEVEAAPEGVRHGEDAAEHFLDEVGFALPLGDEQGGGEDEVNDARFPFDEHRVFQDEGDAAEDEDGDGGQPVLFADRFCARAAQRRLQHGGQS